MGRLARKLLVYDNSTNHCTYRFHNGERVLEDRETAREFLRLIAHYKDRYGVKVHSYCLMGSHPHVSTTATKGQKAFSRFWQCVNHGLAVFHNRRSGRRGQVVMERLRSPLIQRSGGHLLRVMRYGDANPKRAHLVDAPEDWLFSSYRHYALGEENPLIDEPEEYIALGSSRSARRKAYRAFYMLLFIAELNRIPQYTLSPFIGDERWIEAQYQAHGLPLPRTGADPPPLDSKIRDGEEALASIFRMPAA